MELMQVNLGELAPYKYPLTNINLTAVNDITNKPSPVCLIQGLILTYTELFQIFVLHQCPCHFWYPSGINAFNIWISQAFIYLLSFTHLFWTYSKKHNIPFCNTVL